MFLVIIAAERKINSSSDSSKSSSYRSGSSSGGSSSGSTRCGGSRGSNNSGSNCGGASSSCGDGRCKSGSGCTGSGNNYISSSSNNNVVVFVVDVVIPSRTPNSKPNKVYPQVLEYNLRYSTEPRPLSIFTTGVPQDNVPFPSR